VVAVLRATNEAGDVWDDPSEDLLFMLIEELEPGNSFLVVERLDAERAGYFVQVVAGESGSPYVLEYRQGDPGTHQGTSIESMRVVHETMTKWAFDVPGWHEPLSWHAVRY
jgi:hypothetical protein